MPKGNLGQVEPVPPSRVKTTSEDSCRNKARRKKLARLLEANRVLRNIDTLSSIGERNDGCANLLHRIFNGRLEEYTVESAVKEISECISAIHKEQDANKQAEVKHKLAGWRLAMRSSIQAVSKFIKKETAAAPDVISGGQTLETRQAVTAAISQHWKKVWNDKTTKLDEAGVTLQDQIDLVLEGYKDIPMPDHIDWIHPTTDQIFTTMRASAGSASVDGWQGEEVKHFPYGTAVTFTGITTRWRKARKTPYGVKRVRQVNLVKTSKVKKGKIEAGNLRPLSIITVWWRIFLSRIMKLDSMEAWRNHYFPEEVVRREWCTESCAAWVFEQFKKLGFLGTLDFSLCYDHIDPKLVVEVIRALGIPEDLCKLVLDVWANIARCIQFDGHNNPEWLWSGCALMQGDSTGPFALHVLMSSGSRWVRAALVEALRPMCRT